MCSMLILILKVKNMFMNVKYFPQAHTFSKQHDQTIYIVERAEVTYLVGLNALKAIVLPGSPQI